jgi:hypothetical protein
MGDVPIYVAHDSADVWSHQELFRLDEQSSLLAVAGVPPDYFSATGQLWGNPLYRWDVSALPVTAGGSNAFERPLNVRSCATGSLPWVRGLLGSSG